MRVLLPRGSGWADPSQTTLPEDPVNILVSSDVLEQTGQIWKTPPPHKHLFRDCNHEQRNWTKGRRPAEESG